MNMRFLPRIYPNGIFYCFCPYFVEIHINLVKFNFHKTLLFDLLNKDIQVRLPLSSNVSTYSFREQTPYYKYFISKYLDFNTNCCNFQKLKNFSYEIKFVSEQIHYSINYNKLAPSCMNSFKNKILDLFQHLRGASDFVHNCS